MNERLKYVKVVNFMNLLFKDNIFLLLCVFLSFGFLNAIKYPNFIPAASGLQSNGKLIVVGEVLYLDTPNIFIARYNTNGTLDTTFGVSGVTVSLINDQCSASAVVIQSDDKIVISGNAFDSGAQRFLVARYTANGSLDTATFGGGQGYTTTVIPDYAAATGVAIDSSGKIIASGTVVVNGIENFTAVRYTSAGAFELQYSLVIPTGAESANSTSMIIQTDNKIVLGGSVFVSGNSRFALVRYTTAGVPDGTFGASGSVITNINDDDAIFSLALDGTNIVAGGVSDDSFALARYTTAGVLDGTFGSGGVVFTPFAGFSRINKVIMSGSNILVTGFSSNTILTSARYANNGSLDLTFGSGGILRFNDIEASGNSLQIQSGNILNVGALSPSPGADIAGTGYVVTKYSSTGVVDTTYGINGYAIVQSDSFNNANTFNQSTVELFDPISNEIKQLVSGQCMNVAKVNGSTVRIDSTLTNAKGRGEPLIGGSGCSVKSIVGGTCINVTDECANLRISSALTNCSSGTGFTLLDVDNCLMRRISAGSNVTITPGACDISIAASGPFSVYGLFFNSTQGAGIGSGAAISFTNGNTQASGMTLLAGNTQIQLSSAGVYIAIWRFQSATQYKLSFRLQKQTPPGASAPVAGGIQGVGGDTVEWTLGQALFTAAANDIITLVNNNTGTINLGTTTSGTLTADTGLATLIIFKIA